MSTTLVPSAARLLPGSRYRWTVLAVGTGAQAATSAYFQGLASIAPALRQANGLSLTGLGLLLAAPTAGLVLTLLAWGRASDRFGDRAVMTVGLAGSAGCLAGAALAHGPVALGLLLVGAGAVGASVNAASGRAVLAWFTSTQRGMAMGIRQTAAPIGAALAAAALPALVAAGGLRAGFFALAAVCAVAAVAVATWIREPEREPEAAAASSRPTTTAPEPSVFRDRALWRISAASTLLVVPQFTVVTLTVELLHEHRHVPAATAAAVLAVVQIAGAAGRIVVGRWSDRAASRTAPLRTLSAAMAVGALLLAASVSGPLLLLEAALVVEGALVICWNGLAYTAAGELAPPAQRGAALAFQNTGNFIAATATPPAMSAVIDAAGFAPGLALLAVPAAAAGGLLRRPIAVRS